MHEDFKRVAHFIKRLREADKNHFFHAPVDVQALGIPDYYDKIKRPMDFGTIQKKLNLQSYTHPQQVLDDARLVIDNAKSYNHPSSLVHAEALHLERMLDAFSPQTFANSSPTATAASVFFKIASF
jgi:hypothetical protein